MWNNGTQYRIKQSFCTVNFFKFFVLTCCTFQHSPIVALFERLIASVVPFPHVVQDQNFDLINKEQNRFRFFLFFFVRFSLQFDCKKMWTAKTKCGNSNGIDRIKHWIMLPLRFFSLFGCYFGSCMLFIWITNDEFYRKSNKLNESEREREGIEYGL